jgi:phenazine biosynthesis protein phzE
VGFYNTFAAQAPVKRIPGIDVSADPGTGEVHAVRGRRFAGVQFHAESILTSNGPAIIRRLLDDLLP